MVLSWNHVTVKTNMEVPNHTKSITSISRKIWKKGLLKMTSSLHNLVTICQNWLWLGNSQSNSNLQNRPKKFLKKSPPITKLPNKYMRTVWSGRLQNWNPSYKRSQQECCEYQAEFQCNPPWADREQCQWEVAQGEWPWALTDSKQNWGQSALKQERCTIKTIKQWSWCPEGLYSLLLRGFPRSISIRPPPSSWTELVMSYFK